MAQADGMVRSGVRLTDTIPALPARDVAAAAEFYRDRLGFVVHHHDEGFAILRRSEAVLHLWQAGDDSWRGRESFERPVRSGAESFLAGTASCQIRVDAVDELFAELAARDVLHSVSKSGVEKADSGRREFHAVDLDGNLLTFFEWL